eukprot:2581307-Amphidinium_carterae.2
MPQSCVVITGVEVKWLPAGWRWVVVAATYAEGMSPKPRVGRFKPQTQAWWKLLMLVVDRMHDPNVELKDDVDDALRCRCSNRRTAELVELRWLT